MEKTSRVYSIPLRKEFRKVPRYKRAKKAVFAVKTFLAKHMKSDIAQVKIGKFLNLKLWENGIKNPPAKVAIHVEKEEDGVIKAELFGRKFDDSVIKVVKAKSENKNDITNKFKELVTKSQSDTSKPFSKEKMKETAETDKVSKEKKDEKAGKTESKKNVSKKTDEKKGTKSVKKVDKKPVSVKNKNSEKKADNKKNTSKTSSKKAAKKEKSVSNKDIKK